MLIAKIKKKNAFQTMFRCNPDILMLRDIILLTKLFKKIVPFLEEKSNAYKIRWK